MVNFLDVVMAEYDNIKQCRIFYFALWLMSKSKELKSVWYHPMREMIRLSLERMVQYWRSNGSRLTFQQAWLQAYQMHLLARASYILPSTILTEQWNWSHWRNHLQADHLALSLKLLLLFAPSFCLILMLDVFSTLCSKHQHTLKYFIHKGTLSTVLILSFFLFQELGW